MFSILLILHELFGMWYLSSSAVALILTTLVSFLVQKFWAFKDNSLHTVNKQFYAFAALAIFNLFANIVLMYVFVEYFHIWYFMSQVITTGFIATWDFLLYHFVIFPSLHKEFTVQSKPGVINTQKENI